MHPTLTALLGPGLHLSDGAWGTQLQARGLAPGEFPDLWNLEHPDRVLEVARSYVDAGSRIILTNTFGANRLRLGEAGHDDPAKVREVNRAGARISLEAAGTRAQVFASIGPCGKLLLTGEVTAEELQTAFAEQAEALASVGVHGLVVETMSDLDEAVIAVTAARATGLPVVACMVFDSGKDKDRTMSGVTPEAAAKRLTAAGADVIGANCGQGVEGFVPLCRRLKAATERPIWIKANAGLPQWVGDKAVYVVSPEDFASHLPALAEAGASFVGGCCGTTPEFVRALAHRNAELGKVHA